MLQTTCHGFFKEPENRLPYLSRADMGSVDFLILQNLLESKGSAGSLSMDLYFAELLLKLADVVLKSTEQKLRMLGCHYYPGMYFCLWHSGKHTGEIYDKFGGGMRDDGEVRVNTFRLFFPELYIDLLSGLLLVSHW